MFILIQLLFWISNSYNDVCNVRTSRKRPCGPGISATESDCQRLGCCWKQNMKFGIPNCFHPVVEFQEQKQEAEHVDQVRQAIIVQDRCIQKRSKEDCASFFQDGDRCLWTGEYCVVGNDQKCNTYKDEDSCKGRLHEGKACFWNDYYCAEGDVLDCAKYETAHECQKTFHVGFTCIWEINHDLNPTYTCHQDPRDYRAMKCDDFLFEGDCAGQTEGLKTCKWVNNECVIHGVFDCESLSNEKDCTKQTCDWAGDECINPPGSGGGAEAESGGEGAVVDCENEADKEQCNDYPECFWSLEEGECLDIMEAYVPNESSTTSSPPNFVPYAPRPFPYRPPVIPYQPYQPQPQPYQPPQSQGYSGRKYVDPYRPQLYLKSSGQSRKARGSLSPEDAFPSIIDSEAFRISLGVLLFFISCLGSFACVTRCQHRPEQLSTKLITTAETV